jgi:DNA mismatch repair protein MutS
VAYADITTGEFATTQLSSSQVVNEVERLQPAELIIPKDFRADWLVSSIPVSKVDGYCFDFDVAHKVLVDHFGVVSLEGFGCAHLPLAVRAAGAILYYLKENQKSALSRLTRLATYSPQSFMILDAQTRRNLELFTSARHGTGAGSLISVIDLTQTSMGGRLLRRWLGQPLIDVGQLERRQDAVEEFYQSTLLRRELGSLLADVPDLERLINRVRGGTASPRDLVALCSGLEKVAEIREELERVNWRWEWVDEKLKSFPDIVDLIKRAVVEEPVGNLEEGGVIKDGFSSELDEIRMAVRRAKEYLANLEQQERERTGIKSLKVGYNKVFGYYIEISKPNLRLVPPDYIRKQTLAGAERFFTPELKEYESVILSGRERMVELEMAIFRQVCQQVAGAGDEILTTSRTLAQIDVFLGLAEAAARYGYVRPVLNTGTAIVIREGRHPVVERSLGFDGFVPNDTYLCSDDTQIVVLTGPNMSGKSTYLKQVALIVLLAQIGSFVPAESAMIGIVDRIFTRIGAQEDLVAGQSTFMVEMIETANILNNATSKSLVILDEIGRGTSTYDGLSIAWAVVEFIHNHPGLKAKTLFATHYHEMVELANFLPRVKNFNVAVVEEGGKVIFLRKVVPGGADKSYGIHVGQLAGLPKTVIRRAQEILVQLEGEQARLRRSQDIRGGKDVSRQLHLFDNNAALIREIVQLDVDSMTPLEAIAKLYELKRKAQEAGR